VAALLLENKITEGMGRAIAPPDKKPNFKTD